MSQTRRSIGKSVFAVYAAFVAISYLVNYPGRAYPDSIGMLWAAADIQRLDSWHAPVVTFMYGLLDPILGSPAGALLVQSLLIMSWPSLVAVQIATADVKRAAKFALLAGWTVVCIVLIALSGQIVKDVATMGLLSTLLFGVTAPRVIGPSAWWLAVTTGSVALICLVRPPNIAVVVLAVAAIIAFKPGRARHHALTGFAIVAGLVVFTVVFDNVLLPARKTHPENALYVFDLAGISVETNISLFERLGTQGLSKQLPECHTSKHANPLIWGECSELYRVVAEHQDRFPRFWLLSIAEHPIAYLIHRARYSSYLLSNDGSPNKLLVPPPPEYWYAANHPRFIDAVGEEMKRGIQLWQPRVSYLPFGGVAHWVLGSPLGHPLLWVAVCGVGLGYGILRLRRFGDAVPLVVALTGLGNVGLFAAVGPADDIRYLLPTFFAALALPVLMLARRQVRVRDSARNRPAPENPVSRSGENGRPNGRSRTRRWQVRSTG